MKYHPDSGPLRYATAEALNDALGDHMRAVYAELGYKRLRTVLAMRRKAVLVTVDVARKWVDTFGSVSVSSSSASSGIAEKRPAARVAKRPAAADLEMPVSKRPATGASSSQQPAAAEACTSAHEDGRIQLLTSKAVEEACGYRYRAEV